MKGYIYEATNDVNDKVYIGSTIQRPQQRWNEHFSHARLLKERNNHFHNAMRLYGFDKFHFRVIEEVDVATDEELRKVHEQYWIDEYIKRGYTLYNTKRNAARSQFGLKQTEYQKQRMREVHTGNTYGKVLKGRKQTKEHVENKRQSLIANMNKEYKFVSPNGEIVFADNLSNICSLYGLDKSAMVKVHSGKRPSHKGWTKYE